MRKKLCEISNPKQWKTISSDMLQTDGYPVYGANGIIGYYHEYNHKCETLLITCRGATCGGLNICQPYSYVNGNAMALDNLSDDVDIKYLYYYLLNRGLSDVITGSAQPQIVRQSLDKVVVEYPVLNKQKEIVDNLNNIEELISYRKEQLNKLDELVKSRFIEMFGDPETNPMGWLKETLCNHLNVVGGYAFKSELFVEEGIPVLRIGNINAGFFQPINMVYWKHDDNLSRYMMYAGDLVMSLTGTVGKDDYGNVCILGDDYDCYYLNQRNAKLELFKSLDKYYLSQILKFSAIKKKLTGISRGVRQANISNKDILNLEIPIPPIELQNEFATFVEQTDKSKSAVQQSLEKLETLKKSLMQKYFG